MIRAWALALAAALGACGTAGEGAAPAAPAEPEAAAEGEAPAEDGERARIRAVEGAMNEHSAALHACWGRAAAERLGVEGEVVLEVEVGEGGRAAGVDVVRDTAESPVLTECLTELWRDHAWPPGSFEAGELVQLPPFQFVAPDRQFAVDASHVTERDLGDGRTAQLVLREENSGNGDVSLTRLQLESGAALALPSRPESATLVFVVGGSAGLSGGGLPEGQSLRATDAAYAPPGATLKVRAGGPPGGVSRSAAPLELLVAYAPAGPEADFLGDEAAGRGGPGGDAGGAEIRRASAAETYEIASGLGEVSIYIDEPAVGDAAASLGLLTAGPDMVVPPHVHEESSEYLFLLGGRGSMRAGPEAFEVREGMGVQVPPGVEHEFETLGGGPVHAVQIYAPPGPEQRFKTK